MAVCHAAQGNGACTYNASILTQRGVYNLRAICNFGMSYLDKTKFAVQLQAYQGGYLQDLKHFVPAIPTKEIVIVKKLKHGYC